MKRDMDLCRKILLKIEEDECGGSISDLKIEDYSANEVMYHCDLLYQGGFIKEYKRYLYGNFSVGPLTWAGHDFLDKIREDTVWNRTKHVITEKGLPMVLDVVKQVASAVITDMTKGAVEAILGKGGAY